MTTQQAATALPAQPVPQDLLDRLAVAARRVTSAAHRQDPARWRAAAVLDELDAAAGHPGRVEQLAASYDALLEVVPDPTDPQAGWVPHTRHGRRRLGAYATPTYLAQALVQRALPEPSPADPARRPSVVDPSCGAGALLVAALARLVAGGMAPHAAAALLHGVDVDPVAVALARARLLAHVHQLTAGCDTDSRTGEGWLAQRLAAQLRVGDALVDGPDLTWRDAFAHVLARPGPGPGPPDPVTGWTGGFDVVVANPPWERMKVAAAEHDGHDLLPEVKERTRQQVRQVREAGRHPLTGSGDLNAHLPFLETSWRLLADGGRAAVLVPEGAVTDRQAGPLLRALLAGDALESVHTLADPVLFGGARPRVALVTLRRNASVRPGRRRPGLARVVTGVRDACRPELDDERGWDLDARLVRTVNPSSGTAVLFASQRDARLVAQAQERHGVLLARDAFGVPTADPWGLRARTPIHLSREVRHLRHAPGPGLVPVGEAKLAGLLDARAATWADGRVRPATAAELADPGWLPATRWWVPQTLVEQRYGELLGRGWLGAYRVVSTPRTARTLLPVPLPAGAYANSFAVLSAARLPLVLAALASVPLDYVARAKIGGNNLSLFKLEQLPVPAPGAYDVPWPGLDAPTVGHWVLGRLVTAVRWSRHLQPLADELGVDPVGDPPSAQARLAALADLDAVHALLFGWSRSDLEYVFSTFGALRAQQQCRFGSFQQSDLALAAYDRLAGQV